MRRLPVPIHEGLLLEPRRVTNAGIRPRTGSWKTGRMGREGMTLQVQPSWMSEVPNTIPTALLTSREEGITVPRCTKLASCRILTILLRGFPVTVTLTGIGGAPDILTG